MQMFILEISKPCLFQEFYQKRFTESTIPYSMWKM